ncbi:MAG: DUF4867 family protein [Clostridiales bacterium]|nr:DUF4867 family protein [Candidatus Blautia equi]
MTIYSVFDPEFKPYGQVFNGIDDACAEIIEALKKTPLPEGTGYVPTEPILQELAATAVIRDNCYGGMPVQMGWCNGHNTKLNCLEYHRDSEFNLGTEDFILLLAKMDDIVDGKLDTAKVKAFRAPAGVLVEVFGSSLHYAPCHTDASKGFQVLIALPWATNTEMPEGFKVRGGDDKLLWARNKWLLAHAESSEAADGAYVGLVGENIDIAGLI